MPVPIIAENRIWPISLEQIEATVADYLGPGRVKSKSPAAVFSRHVSMYLAKHVGGWRYPKIRRFYGCKHYATRFLRSSEDRATPRLG
jgi:chromosomal replication initiation ATPase DnaA